MDAEQVFKLAAAAIKVAEELEDYIEIHGDISVDGADYEVMDALWGEVMDALEEYQHARDRG